MSDRFNQVEVQDCNSVTKPQTTLPAISLRSYVTEDDGIVTINGSQRVVARMGSRVNALGGMVIAEEQSDIRARVGAHVEFLPGSNGIIEFGADFKLWSGATVKIVDDIKPFLHSDLTINF